jgi:SAM-dependent methyltransferase
MSIRQETINCLICNSTQSEPFYADVPDRFNPDKTYREVICSKCGFVYLSPRPVEEEMSRFYDLQDYHPHHLSETAAFDKVYARVRNRNSQNKRNLIAKYCPGGHLLDIGCGTGEFLMEMKKNNWLVTGLETADEAREIAMRKGLQVSDKLWKVEGLFDVVTLWHVLEHIHRVDNLFTHIKRLLSPDGYLILALPNRESIDAGYYKNHWVALDAPRHLYHFRPIDIEKLFKQYGLEIIKISPLLHFDAWYNALLSAKLKSAVKNKSLLPQLPVALLIALSSFIRGLTNGKKCASPVYITRINTRENQQ